MPTPKKIVAARALSAPDARRSRRGLSLPVVQYMYSICTVFVRFRSVQILYIYCTYTVQRAERVVKISKLQGRFLGRSDG